MSYEDRRKAAAVDAGVGCKPFSQDPQAKLIAKSGPHETEFIADLCGYTSAAVRVVMRSAAAKMWINDPETCEELIEAARSGCLDDNLTHFAGWLAERKKFLRTTMAA